MIHDQLTELPNSAELTWIAENLATARQLSGASASELLNPALLDRGLHLWHAQPLQSQLEPNLVANALGIAFGQCLIDQFEMHWVIVSDSHGTELAVQGSPSEILVFPTVAAAKRISNDEAAFFQELYRQVSADIRHIRNEGHN